MDSLTEKYFLYKNAISIQKNYFNFSNKGKLKLRCSNCGKIVTINGCNSHYKLCSTIYNDKYNFIIDYFKGYEKSVVSGSKIELNHDRRLDKWYIVVNNSKEYLAMINYVYRYENYYKLCKICNSPIISKYNCCSEECSTILLSNSIKKYHSIDNDEYKKRNLKISQTRKLKKIIQKPWNKGMVGEEYLSHYLKSDGSNSLMLSLHNNERWFRKTSIEEKFENLLLKLNISYNYNFLYGRSQFDFKLDINNKRIIVEVDGDYWHKSSRRCCDTNIMNMKRNEDKLKENFMINNGFLFIRFWEYNINNNLDIIEKYLINILSNIYLDKTLDDIKEYYLKNS